MRFAAHTKASDTPVLPPVYSTTEPPGRSRPSASAASTIASAMRSFMLPVGFSNSSLTRILALSGGTMCWSGMSRVRPIVSSTVTVVLPARRISDPVEHLPRQRAAGVAGIERRHGLEEEDVGFLLGDWTVLDATWDHEELAGGKADGPVAQLHVEGALDDEEHFVFRLVLVPRERSLELHELHVLPVQLGDDLRIPVRGAERELLPEVDLVEAAYHAHGESLSRGFARPWGALRARQLLKDPWRTRRRRRR